MEHIHWSTNISQYRLGLQAEGVPKMETDNIVINSLLYGDDEGFIRVKNVGHQPTRSWEPVRGHPSLQFKSEEPSVSREEPGRRMVVCSMGDDDISLQERAILYVYFNNIIWQLAFGLIMH